jgi:hypothetical protein
MPTSFTAICFVIMNTEDIDASICLLWFANRRLMIWSLVHFSMIVGAFFKMHWTCVRTAQFRWLIVNALQFPLMLNK